MSSPKYIRKKGQGEGTLGRGGIHCEVLSDWLFLVDCSKAVHFLLDIIIAARKKRFIGRQMPDSFSCKIEYLRIYLHLEK